jgi:adenine-specific DNA-methyltransferase
MAKNNPVNKTPKTVETITHDEAKRKNIPTAEFESVMRKDEKTPIRAAYERRNKDLDPQLVWRGKDVQDWSDLVVHAPPLYIQEKVHPKVLIDDLKRLSEQENKGKAGSAQIDLFANFNGLPSQEAKTEFYQHDSNWSNRMILGDSLQVMASLAEREGLRGKVQCFYFDPPYGIKFNSNFQWSTTSPKINPSDRVTEITREPEQVKAFRDTWRDGIHSYLNYLRDRLTIARELLTESGSIFFQISDENVHRARALLDEVFGESNFIAQILFRKTGGLTTNFLSSVGDYILWYGKDRDNTKFRSLYLPKCPGETGATQFKYELLDNGTLKDITFEQAVNLPSEKVVYHDNITSQGNTPYVFNYHGEKFERGYKPSPQNLPRVDKAGRFIVIGKTPRYLRKLSDLGVFAINEFWEDLSISGFADPKIYVVQTTLSAIQRCVLMVTDPGDLVLDPTCGSGTTAYVAEQWGRRWITIDTSRVALALARARIMGARYPYYLLSDSKDGQRKEGEITQKEPSSSPTFNSIRQGFVYERVPHITLKSIANNAEIDVIWEKYEQKLKPVREQLSVDSGQQRTLEEWEIPRDFPSNYPLSTKQLFTTFWSIRIARQKEIDASISAKAEYEFLYDKPYEDNKKVRVSGPFTLESLSPHRMLAVDADDELIDTLREPSSDFGEKQDFAQMILENLKTSGIQQAHKEDKINFTSITPWPGEYICAEGRYMEGTTERRTGIFIGPEFGTVAREDLVKAARECGDADFDVLVACAFSYEAHTTEFEKLGRISVLKARMCPIRQIMRPAS